MEAATGRFAVLLLDQHPLNVGAVAPVVVAHLNLHRIDANRAVRRQRGILAENLAEPVAEALVQALEAIEVGAEVVDSAFIDPLPRPKTTYYLDPQPEGLFIAKEPGKPVPWEAVELVAVGAMLPSGGISSDESARFQGRSNVLGASLTGLTEEEKRAVRAIVGDSRDLAPEDAIGGGHPPISTPPFPVTLPELPRWLAIVERTEFELVAAKLPEMLVEIVLRDPYRRYRVDARELMPAPLGESRSPNWLRNLWLIVQRMANYLPKSAVSPGGWAFLQQRGDWELLFDLRSEFDESVRWLAFRRRQAEIGTLIDADRLAPEPDEALAAPGDDIEALPEPPAEPESSTITRPLSDVAPGLTAHPDTAAHPDTEADAGDSSAH